MAKVSWASLAKGRELPPRHFRLSRDWLRQYIEATEDGASAALGDEAVPVMAVAALAVRSLLEGVELPAGALHVGQELECRRLLNVGESLAAKAQVASAGERSGWFLVAIDLRVEDGSGEAVLVGRSTLTAPTGG
jgi:acyl dehydratase